MLHRTSTVNSFTSKIPIILWWYQFDPIMNLYDPLFNFKVMFDFKLTILTKTESDYILSKMPQITDVQIVCFMCKLDEIDNAYNKSFLLWLIIVITICSILVASFLIFLCIWQRFNKECNQCITRFKRKLPKECPTIEIEPVVSGTKARIQKLWKRKASMQSLWIIYEKEIWTHPLQHPVVNLVPLCLPWQGGEIQH